MNKIIISFPTSCPIVGLKNEIKVPTFEYTPIISCPLFLYKFCPFFFMTTLIWSVHKVETDKTIAIMI